MKIFWQGADQWNIIQIKSGREWKVSQILKRRQIPHYLPLCTTNTEYDPKKYNYLLPSYIFVNLCNTPYKNVLKIKDVLNFMYWLNEPISVPERVVNILKLLIQNDRSVYIEKIKIHAPAANQSHIILNHYVEKSPLGSMETKVKIILPLIGYCLVLNCNEAFYRMLKEYTLPAHLELIE